MLGYAIYFAGAISVLAGEKLKLESGRHYDRIFYFYVASSLLSVFLGETVSAVAGALMIAYVTYRFLAKRKTYFFFRRKTKSDEKNRSH